MLPFDLGLRFERLEFRLREEVRRRINNGELTERGLARRIGISQPHIHNILKGLRAMSPAIADLILEELGLSVLDLVQTAELGTALSLRTPGGSRRVHVGVVEGRISARSPFPDLGEVSHWLSLPADALRGAKRPILSEVELDLSLLGVFQRPEVALLDTDESRRLKLDPHAWYLVRIDGIGLIRQLRNRAGALVMLGQQSLLDSAPHVELDLRAATQLQYVRARVVWIGPDPRRDYFASLPAASS